MKRRRRSFTLIEVIIAMAVIGVLASTAAVTYQRHKRRSQYKAMRINVRVLTEAMKSYFYSMRAYCVTGSTGVTNTAYGTFLRDRNFCRYRVYLTGVAPRVRVEYFRQGCTVGACTGVFRYNISGDQIACAGADCMT